MFDRKISLFIKQIFRAVQFTHLWFLVAYIVIVWVVLHIQPLSQTLMDSHQESCNFNYLIPYHTYCPIQSKIEEIKYNYTLKSILIIALPLDSQVYLIIYPLKLY